MEANDPVTLVRFDHSEFMSMTTVNWQCGNGTCRIQMLVEFDHVGDIHPIDVIGAKDRDNVRVRLFDEVDVLVDGVGGSLIPGLSGGPHLGRNRDDELVI